MLEGAKGTSGYDRFASRAARCEAALSELEERIKALSSVQRKWLYLDPVYGSGAAPSDSGRWSRADKEFRFVKLHQSDLIRLRSFSVFLSFISYDLLYIKRQFCLYANF